MEAPLILVVERVAHLSKVICYGFHKVSMFLNAVYTPNVSKLSLDPSSLVAFSLPLRKEENENLLDRLRIILPGLIEGTRNHSDGRLIDTRDTPISNKV